MKVDYPSQNALPKGNKNRHKVQGVIKQNTTAYKKCKI